MKTNRTIKEIYNAPVVMMGNIKLRQAFPLPELQQISPFILLHHFDFNIKPNDEAFYVAPHPHRGFSPVTFMFDGQVEHKDSLGNQQVIGSNEVQWINAGRGIIHSERADSEFVKQGGRYRGIQLWINTPKALKMEPASYQPITTQELKIIQENGVEIRLVSGELEGLKGPAKSEVITAMMRMDSGSSYTLNLDNSEHVTIYILEGDLEINQQTQANQHQLIWFDSSTGAIHLKAQSNAVLLLMAGNPIDEPLVSYGPFVMNSQTEIMEAMKDYQQGKMGFLY